MQMYMVWVQPIGALMSGLCPWLQPAKKNPTSTHDMISLRLPSAGSIDPRFSVFSPQLINPQSCLASLKSLRRKVQPTG